MSLTDFYFYRLNERPEQNAPNSLYFIKDGIYAELYMTDASGNEVGLFHRQAIQEEVTNNTAVLANTTKVGLPIGGTTGQQLVKATDANYDTEWVDAAAGGGGGDSYKLLSSNITSSSTVQIAAMAVVYEPNTWYEIEILFLTKPGAITLGMVADTAPPVNWFYLVSDAAQPRIAREITEDFFFGFSFPSWSILNPAPGGGSMTQSVIKGVFLTGPSGFTLTPTWRSVSGSGTVHAGSYLKFNKIQ